MAMTHKRRGFIAAGLVVLLAGLAIGVALYVISLRRPAATVGRYARAPVGCVTTLSFAEAGTFLVYEETGNDGQGVATGCEPAATPGVTFAVEFTGDRTPIEVSPMTDVSYDVDDFVGRSVLTVQIADPGEYVIEVIGPDTAVVAAVGGEPDEGVDDLRRSAFAVAVAGTLLGLGLMAWGRRRGVEEPAAGGDDVMSSRAAWGPPTAPPARGPGPPVQPLAAPGEPQAELAGWPPTPPDIATSVVGTSNRGDSDRAADADVSTDVSTDVSRDARADVDSDVNADVTSDVDGDADHVDLGTEPEESPASPWARDADDTVG